MDIPNYVLACTDGEKVTIPKYVLVCTDGEKIASGSDANRGLTRVVKSVDVRKKYKQNVTTKTNRALSSMGSFYGTKL